MKLEAAAASREPAADAGRNSQSSNPRVGPDRRSLGAQMNYFAHGRDYAGQPYLLAGTATPDWLSVADRRVRTSSKRAQPLVNDPDPATAAVARGIVRHHYDDAWFHQTAAFAELSMQLTASVRNRLHDDGGLRSGFLGHILVELLLDAELIDEAPERLDDYYAALDKVDPEVVRRTVERIANRPCGRLAVLIPLFSTERFLYDYASDGKLLERLNHVMRRVKLPPLPPSIREMLPEARRLVRQRKSQLLAGADK